MGLWFFVKRALTFIFCTSHSIGLGRKAERAKETIYVDFSEAGHFSIKAFMTRARPYCWF